MMLKKTIKAKKKPEVSRGGRPSREDAGKIKDKILNAATALFFKDGYGLVSIEDVVKLAQISKRTLYARYENKAALFQAVVHRIILAVQPPNIATDKLFTGKNAEEVLRRIAPVILHASLSSDALALHRIVLAEARRFPELALIMNEQGARQEAIQRITTLLRHDNRTKKIAALDAAFAAEQFLFMLTAAPQRRASGLGIAMTAQELDAWARRTVDLFLHGIWSL